MKEIREALERTKERNFDTARHEHQEHPTPINGEFTPTLLPKIETPNQCWALDAAHLASKRITAYDHGEAHAPSFDMLRTQVLQSMDGRDWRFLGITSPTVGCGKTVTAINLALSIGRQPERSVLLLDLDLRKPQVASCLGLKPKDGILSVLENRSPLADAIAEVGVGDCRMMILPTETPASRSSDRMASRAMNELLDQIKREFQSQIIIVDLPPLLSSDDALAVLPKLDCMLLVTAVGRTTSAEINELAKHLRSIEIVRIVANKMQPSKSKYYY
jgi:Mrp family chromosome partitioning ATPase